MRERGKKGRAMNQKEKYPGLGPRPLPFFRKELLRQAIYFYFGEWYTECAKNRKREPL